MGMSAGGGKKAATAVPYINVTPLIDVLLVLLIIFMVITPLKPTRFKALVPEEPDPNLDLSQVKPNPLTLVVSIEKDLGIKLNTDTAGSVNDTSSLSTRLSGIFNDRKNNRAYKPGYENRLELPEVAPNEKTGSVLPPRPRPYGDVLKVIDATKDAGANPVGLQIDDLAQ